MKTKKMYLTLIEWIIKTTGEAKAMYAYVSNPVTTITFADGQQGSFRPTPKTDDDETAPIWLPKMTSDLYTIYKKRGQDVILFNPKDPKAFTYCGENFTASESTTNAESTQLPAE